MTLHLVKLCVGCDSVEDLRQWQRRRLATARADYGRRVLFHFTRNRPRRDAELIAGGSLYWVIKGFILVRQRIVGIEDWEDEKKGRYCGLRLGPRLVRTEPRAMRPFQGWRYLEAKAVPADLIGRGREHLPPAMAAELRSLGLL